jgi:medium-chain acyl-[acyl-carrier-protein] hydrolase
VSRSPLLRFEFFSEDEIIKCLDLDLASLVADAEGCLASFLSEIHNLGISIDWNQFYLSCDLRKISVPTYGFDETLFSLPSFRVSLADPPPTIPKHAKWFQCLTNRRQAKLRLYCFSYAGGSSEVFKKWTHLVHPEIELNLVVLPGKDQRLEEPLALDLNILVDQLYEAFCAQITEVPFAFYGHSAGGLIAFELSRRISAALNREPHFIMLGASLPPQEYSSLFTRDGRREPISILSDSRFLNEIKKWEGSLRSDTENLVDLKKVMPILRADFIMLEGYRYNTGAKLNCPLHILGGELDTMNKDKLSRWSETTTGITKVEILPEEGHFFVNSNWKIVVTKLNEIFLLGASAATQSTKPLREAKGSLL